MPAPPLTTSDWVVFIIAILVSIALTFLPKLKDWWKTQTRDFRTQIILVICLVVSVVAFVLACFGVIVAPDAVCPDYSTVSGLAVALYHVFGIAAAAAGVVQALYTYGLKPIDNWLTLRALNRRIGPG